MISIDWADWGLTAPRALRPVSGGLINASFCATWDDGSARFVQQVNRSVFVNLEAIEHNLRLVADSSASRFAVTPERRRDGAVHSSEAWRIFRWVDAGTREATPHELGAFWGRFNAELNRAPQPWACVLPDFHSARIRYAQWVAVRNQVPQAYADLALELEAWSQPYQSLEARLMPAVQHHDAKRSNVLLGEEGLRAVDLDTLQPGYLGSDFGDLVRSAAALRDEDDPKGNGLDPKVFEALWEGYAGEFRAAEARAEQVRAMPAYLTWIQALRFAGDAASGAGYYPESYPGHNWVRTRNQLELHASMVRNQG